MNDMDLLPALPRKSGAFACNIDVTFRHENIAVRRLRVDMVSS
jgi:hypothetical protein